MKKSVILTSLFGLALLSWTSCSTNFISGDKKDVKDTVYVINGTLENLDAGTINLGYRFDGNSFTDSAKIEKGEFHFKGSVKDPQRAYLTLQVGEEYQEVVFFLDNGVTTISARADSLEGAHISGTAVQDEFVTYTAQMKTYEDQMEKFDQAYENFTNPSPATMDSLLAAYEAIMASKLIAIKNYIQAHPESFVAATEVLNNFAYDPKASQLDSVYNFFAPSIRSSPVGVKIGQMVEIAKKTDVGQIAPDFTLNDTHDKAKALSSLRGKILLVDFWASWCGPCREENPNIVNTFKKYHPKGLNILGVSLDTKKDRWLKAIDDDQLTWDHVSDLNGWKSSAAALYGIRAIPMNYLLDKDGKIVAKNLRGEKLTNAVEALLK